MDKDVTKVQIYNTIQTLSNSKYNTIMMIDIKIIQFDRVFSVSDMVR